MSRNIPHSRCAGVALLRLCVLSIVLVLAALDSAGRRPLPPAVGESPPSGSAIRGFTYLRKNRQGLREYRHEKIGIVFVRLPAGSFVMGSAETEPGSRRAERPQHRVSVDSFLIAKYEVSQTEWKRVMGSNPSHFRGDDLPVEMVSWTDCEKFCKKTGLWFATEAQWEYACRAGTKTPFAFGKTITTEQVNYGIAPSRRPPAGSYRETTVAVGSFPPNRFGLHDMHGNVEEWCADVYVPEFYGMREASRKNPLCTSGSDRRSLRGGSWFHDSDICRSAFRAGYLEKIRFRTLGFRPAWPRRP